MATSSGGPSEPNTLGQCRAKFGSVPDIHEGTPMSVCDTSDSDEETEPAESFHRRISTNKNIKTTVSSWLVSIDAATRCAPSVGTINISNRFVGYVGYFL